MNRLPVATRAAIIKGMVEGSSIRSVSRLTGASKGAVLRLLAEVGGFCAAFQHYRLRRLPCVRVEADEVWGFCGAKEKNATKPGQGDLWTYTAICADSKLLISWLIGPRSKYATRAFIRDLAGRMAGKIQLTTDGLLWYEPAVRAAFGSERCDYGQIVKRYGVEVNPTAPIASRRYSPAICTGATKYAVMGRPKMEYVSTSYVERNNLAIRQGMKRMARLTNAFSKRAENHAHAFAIHAMHFNYCRPHGTLTKKANGTKTTPAMTAGLASRPWTVEDVLARMDRIFVTL